MQNTKRGPQEQILPIVLGFWQARALAVATEFGLPDLLAEGPLRVDELASRSKTNASALFRLLRAALERVVSGRSGDHWWRTKLDLGSGERPLAGEE